MAILRLEDINFSYGKTKVLKNVNYSFEKGKIYAVVGQSGAGKTTLLSVLSGLAAPEKGTIWYEDKNIRSVNKYKFRSRYVGVIFQNFNLLTKLTAAENVRLSMDVAGIKEKSRAKKAKAYSLLDRVGLTKEEADRRVLKLSGGQQQRVAIARALSYDPDIILADEPTGNLDMQTQNEIMAIFRKLADEGKCVIIVTHSPDVAKLSDEIFELKKH